MKECSFPSASFPRSFSLVKVLLFLLLPGTISCQMNNMTLEYSTGSEITEAVIRQIIRSQIFPDDYSFLFRLAYVESRFGERESTFRDGYYGGIWQVDRAKLSMTKNITAAAILFPLYEKIYEHFNISWESVRWDDLLKPLYSGLAARLYFVVINEPIPDTITRQAHLWKERYRPETGEEEVFSQDSKILQDQSLGGCRGKIDLCIALDASSSITVQKFDIAKAFITQLIQMFDSSMTFTRIGMFVFSNKPYHTFYVENTLSTSKMASLAQSVSFPYGDTRTDLALLYGMGLLKNVTEVRRGVPQVIFLLTDGQSSTPIDESAKTLAENGIKTVVVGVGKDINHTEMMAIGLGNKRNVLNVSDFEALSDFLLRLNPILCSMQQMKLFTEQIYGDGLSRNERRYYILDIGNEEGITVFVDVKVGVVNAFWSYDEEIPSDAVHDGVIDGVTFFSGTVEKKRPSDGRNSKRATGLDEEDKVYLQSVFVTIEGLEDYNEYEIHTLMGDHDVDDRHGFNSADGGKVAFGALVICTTMLLFNI